MKTRTIRHSIILKATPLQIFNTFMDSKKHSQFTKAESNISKENGGEFSIFDGMVTGINKEIIPGQRIVQSWKGVNWPTKDFTQVIFDFKKVRSGTFLQLTHKNVPYYQYGAIKKGWRKYYFVPLKKKLNRGTNN